MPRSLRQPFSSTWIVGILLALFVVAGVIGYWNANGEDLGSSYIGCRIVASSHPDALFSYDSDSFADVGSDKIWPDLARQGNYHNYLHPYVQTPLWAWSLRPLCGHMGFPAFEHLFLILAVLAVAGMVYLTARYWTPRLLHPAALALVLLVFWCSRPFSYTMFLVQTHPLYLFLAVAGLILAERDRPIAAGLLVAYAAAIKVTPAALLLYWIFSRRWRAAISMAAWSAVLLVLTAMAVGPHLLSLYFTNLHRVSRVLLLAENNQSFAAWAMGRFYPSDEVFDVNIFPLPAALRLGSELLLLGCAAAAGLVDRGRRSLAIHDRTVPLGAGMALVGMTVFAPIAWTHYYIILVVPAMMLVQEGWRLWEDRNPGAWIILILVVIIALLNYPPLAPQVETMDLSDFALLRSHFYSGVLCLAALGYAAWLRSRHVVQEEKLKVISHS